MLPRRPTAQREPRTRHTPSHPTPQHTPVQFSTIRHDRIQDDTIQHNTKQYNTTQIQPDTTPRHAIRRDSRTASRPGCLPGTLKIMTILLRMITIIMMIIIILIVYNDSNTDNDDTNDEYRYYTGRLLIAQLPDWAASHRQIIPYRLYWSRSSDQGQGRFHHS